jgi:8-oxo-dGTP diphosphatase
MQKSDKNRTKTRVAVYLVLMENGRVLLGKRQNTGHMDGYWGLPAGHVYEQESCLAAIMRETQEECGLDLSLLNLSLIGAMHHKSGEFDYLNYIFRTELGVQKVANLEPFKCAQLKFFSPNYLPEPIDDYIKFIIQKSCFSTAPWIAEYGW